MSDVDFSHFVDAQDADECYLRALRELSAGKKVGHWMWFVFPQLAGLGSSTMAKRFALSSLDEARAYLRHRVLGRRLRESATVLLDRAGIDADAILGSLDAMKLRSSMTLFARAAPEEGLFAAVLAQYFGAEPDPLTERLLAGRQPPEPSA